jgi:hypothetical protein
MYLMSCISYIPSVETPTEKIKSDNQDNTEKVSMLFYKQHKTTISINPCGAGYFSADPLCRAGRWRWPTPQCSNGGMCGRRPAASPTVVLAVYPGRCSTLTHLLVGHTPPSVAGDIGLLIHVLVWDWRVPFRSLTACAFDLQFCATPLYEHSHWGDEM